MRVHLEHESALGCMHESALGCLECTGCMRVHLEHESALGCLRVHLDVWSALRCMRVHLDVWSALECLECTGMHESALGCVCYAHAQNGTGWTRASLARLDPLPLPHTLDTPTGNTPLKPSPRPLLQRIRRKV